MSGENIQDLLKQYEQEENAHFQQSIGDVKMDLSDASDSEEDLDKIGEMDPGRPTSVISDENEQQELFQEDRPTFHESRHLSQKTFSKLILKRDMITGFYCNKDRYPFNINYYVLHFYVRLLIPEEFRAEVQPFYPDVDPKAPLYGIAEISRVIRRNKEYKIYAPRHIKEKSPNNEPRWKVKMEKKLIDLYLEVKWFGKRHVTKISYISNSRITTDEFNVFVHFNIDEDHEHVLRPNEEELTNESVERHFAIRRKIFRKVIPEELHQLMAEDAIKDGRDISNPHRELMELNFKLKDPSLSRKDLSSLKRRIHELTKIIQHRDKRRQMEKQKRDLQEKAALKRFITKKALSNRKSTPKAGDSFEKQQKHTYEREMNESEKAHNQKFTDADIGLFQEKYDKLLRGDEFQPTIHFQPKSRSLPLPPETVNDEPFNFHGNEGKFLNENGQSMLKKYLQLVDSGNLKSPSRQFRPSAYLLLLREHEKTEAVFFELYFLGKSLW